VTAGVQERVGGERRYDRIRRARAVVAPARLDVEVVAPAGTFAGPNRAPRELVRELRGERFVPGQPGIARRKQRKRLRVPSLRDTEQRP